MLNRFFGLDSDRALLAVKTCVALLCGYALALRFNWNASYLATTVIVLQTASVGSTFSKAATRMAGTLVGALVGLALVALCAHSRELFTVSMALVTGVCVWAMQTSKHQYAWLLVVITSAVVGWSSALSPHNVFPTTVDRVTAVTAGVILSGLVHALFFPVTAAFQRERTIREVLEGCRNLLSLVRDRLTGGTVDEAQLDAAAAGVVTLSESLDATLQAARVDSKLVRRHFGNHQRLNDQLTDLALSAAAVADAAVQCTRDAVAETTLASLAQTMGSLDKTCADTIEQLSLPRDGTAVEAPSQASDETNTPQQSAATAPALLGDRIRTFRGVAVQVRAELASLESDPPGQTAEQPETPAAPPLKKRFGKSLLASCQVLLGASFFMLLDWPLGLQAAMIPVMFIAYTNAQLPMSLLASTILKSIASALPVAAVFHFLIMPGIDSFTQLMPWMALLFLPYFYFIASRNPLTSLAAMVSVIIAKSLISISTAPPSYDFATFANTYIGMGGGFGLVLLLAYLVETRSPRHGLHKLLAGVLSQSGDGLKALDERPPTPTGDTLAAGQRRQWLERLGQMKRLSATVDFGQDPYISRRQMGTVVDAFEVLLMRLTWASFLNTSSQAYSETENEAVRRARDWCIEALTSTGRALAELGPAPALTPPNGILQSLVPATEARLDSSDHDLRGQSVTQAGNLGSLDAYYRSLSDAILCCQTNLESINWKRWCWTHF